MPTPKESVRRETTFEYIDKLTNRPLRFRPSSDERVVTLEPIESDAMARNIVAALPVSEGKRVDYDRGFAVLRTQPSDAVAAAAPSGVVNSLPAMVDGDGLTRYFLPDEFTVQFRRNVDRATIDRIFRERSCRIVSEQRTPGYFTVTVPAERGLFEMVREFTALSDVEFAEPSEVGFNDELYTPNATAFGQLWGLENTGQTVDSVSGTPGSDISATGAWDDEKGRPEVIVVVIDTGCDMSHPNLLPNLLPRGGEDWNFAAGNDKEPTDSDSHGTHVAGTAAAAENREPVVGVAFGTRIMPLKVDLTAGMNANRADAINYATDQVLANPDRRYVINCSWRMSGDHAGVRSAIERAVRENLVVVFAAGNADQDIDVTPQYPAVYPEVIAVAALDNRDVRASFSNYGTKVDVSAPGIAIFSTVPGGHGAMDGTSMASPHVAGVAALIWSKNALLSNRDVRRIIEDSCDDIDGVNPGYAGKLGRGRINARAALSRA